MFELYKKTLKTSENITVKLIKNANPLFKNSRDNKNIAITRINELKIPALYRVLIFSPKIINKKALI